MSNSRIYEFIQTYSPPNASVSSTASTTSTIAADKTIHLYYCHDNAKVDQNRIQDFLLRVSHYLAEYEFDKKEIANKARRYYIRFPQSDSFTSNPIILNLEDEQKPDQVRVITIPFVSIERDRLHFYPLNSQQYKAKTLEAISNDNNKLTPADIFAHFKNDDTNKTARSIFDNHQSQYAKNIIDSLKAKIIIRLIHQVAVFYNKDTKYQEIALKLLNVIGTDNYTIDNKYLKISRDKLEQLELAQIEKIVKEILVILKPATFSFFDDSNAKEIREKLLDSSKLIISDIENEIATNRANYWPEAVPTLFALTAFDFSFSIAVKSIEQIAKNNPTANNEVVTSNEIKAAHAPVSTSDHSTSSVSSTSSSSTASLVRVNLSDSLSAPVKRSPILSKNNAQKKESELQSAFDNKLSIITSAKTRVTNANTSTVLDELIKQSQKQFKSDLENGKTQAKRSIDKSKSAPSIDPFAHITTHVFNPLDFCANNFDAVITYLEADAQTYPRNSFKDIAENLPLMLVKNQLVNQYNEKIGEINKYLVTVTHSRTKTVLINAIKTNKALFTKSLDLGIKIYKEKKYNLTEKVDTSTFIETCFSKVNSECIQPALKCATQFPDVVKYIELKQASLDAKNLLDAQQGITETELTLSLKNIADNSGNAKTTQSIQKAITTNSGENEFQSLKKFLEDNGKKFREIFALEGIVINDKKVYQGVIEETFNELSSVNSAVDFSKNIADYKIKQQKLAQVIDLWVRDESFKKGIINIFNKQKIYTAKLKDLEKTLNDSEDNIKNYSNSLSSSSGSISNTNHIASQSALSQDDFLQTKMTHVQAEITKQLEALTQKNNVYRTQLNTLKNDIQFALYNNLQGSGLNTDIKKANDSLSITNSSIENQIKIIDDHYTLEKTHLSNLKSNNNAQMDLILNEAANELHAIVPHEIPAITSADFDKYEHDKADDVAIKDLEKTLTENTDRLKQLCSLYAEARQEVNGYTVYYFKTLPENLDSYRNKFILTPTKIYFVFDNKDIIERDHANSLEELMKKIGQSKTIDQTHLSSAEVKALITAKTGLTPIRYQSSRNTSKKILDTNSQSQTAILKQKKREELNKQIEELEARLHTLKADHHWEKEELNQSKKNSSSTENTDTDNAIAALDINYEKLKKHNEDRIAILKEKQNKLLLQSSPSLPDQKLEEDAQKARYRLIKKSAILKSRCDKANKERQEMIAKRQAIIDKVIDYAHKRSDYVDATQKAITQKKQQVAFLKSKLNGSQSILVINALDHKNINPNILKAARETHTPILINENGHFYLYGNSYGTNDDNQWGFAKLESDKLNAFISNSKLTISNHPKSIELSYNIFKSDLILALRDAHPNIEPVELNGNEANNKDRVFVNASVKRQLALYELDRAEKNLNTANENLTEIKSRAYFDNSALAIKQNTIAIQLANIDSTITRSNVNEAVESIHEANFKIKIRKEFINHQTDLCQQIQNTINNVSATDAYSYITKMENISLVAGDTTLSFKELQERATHHTYQAHNAALDECDKTIKHIVQAKLVVLEQIKKQSADALEKIKNSTLGGAEHELTIEQIRSSYTENSHQFAVLLSDLSAEMDAALAKHRNAINSLCRKMLDEQNFNQNQKKTLIPIIEYSNTEEYGSYDNIINEKNDDIPAWAIVTKQNHKKASQLLTPLIAKMNGIVTNAKYMNSELDTYFDSNDKANVSELNIPAFSTSVNVKTNQFSKIKVEISTALTNPSVQHFKHAAETEGCKIAPMETIVELERQDLERARETYVRYVTKLIHESVMLIDGDDEDNEQTDEIKSSFNKALENYDNASKNNNNERAEADTKFLNEVYQIANKAPENSEPSIKHLKEFLNIENRSKLYANKDPLPAIRHIPPVTPLSFWERTTTIISNTFFLVAGVCLLFITPGTGLNLIVNSLKGLGFGESSDKKNQKGKANKVTAPAPKQNDASAPIAGNSASTVNIMRATAPQNVPNTEEATSTSSSVSSSFSGGESPSASSGTTRRRVPRPRPFLNNSQNNNAGTGTDSDTVQSLRLSYGSSDNS